MKALSLLQPWAQLIAIGAKRVETRSWSTPYRGELAIHASKSWQAEDRELCWNPEFRAALEPTGLIDYGRHYAPFSWVRQARDGEADPLRARQRFMLPLGAIVAVVTLGDVIRAERCHALWEEERTFGNYGPGRYAWTLVDIHPLREPVPCRGALGIWTVPPDIERAVREALP